LIPANNGTGKGNSYSASGRPINSLRIDRLINISDGTNTQTTHTHFENKFGC